MPRTGRYEDVQRFAPPDDGGVAFPGLRPRVPETAAGVLEHRLASSERPDLLALHYYNDVRRWWRLLDANPERLCGADLTDTARVGELLLIPPADERSRTP